MHELVVVDQVPGMYSMPRDLNSIQGRVLQGRQAPTCRHARDRCGTPSSGGWIKAPWQQGLLQPSMVQGAYVPPPGPAGLGDASRACGRGEAGFAGSMGQVFAVRIGWEALGRSVSTGYVHNGQCMMHHWAGGMEPLGPPAASLGHHGAWSPWAACRMMALPYPGVVRVCC